VLLNIVTFVNRLRHRNDLYCVEWGVKLYSLTLTDQFPNLFIYENCRYRIIDVKYILVFIVHKIFYVVDIRCCYWCFRLLFIYYYLLFNIKT